MCSRTMSPPAWCATRTAIPAACAGPLGCGIDERGGAMKSTLIARVAAVLAIGGLATGAIAGPEKITFPHDYLKGVLYQTLDRPDNKQYRELYAPASAVEAVKKGQPI